MHPRIMQPVRPGRRWAVPMVGAAIVLLGLTFLLTLNDGSAAQEAELERLEFKPGVPHTVTIYAGAGGDGDRVSYRRSGRIFWYLPYSLKSLSSKKTKFFVTVSAIDDKKVTYSDLILADVEKKIESMEQRELWSKVDRNKAGARVNEYEEFEPGQSRECVAIFNPIDPEADKITLRVFGLVNDVEMENLSGTKWRISERVLEVIFERPGDEYYTSLDKFNFVGQKWVTESREVELATGEKDTGEKD